MKKKLLFILFFYISLTLGAATFNVNTAIDENDGSCADGDCSLRDAIILANANGQADIINVPTGTYTLTTSTRLSITSDITISGAGESNTIIEAHINPNTATWRVFSVQSNGTDAIFEDITIRHGRSSGFGGGVLINLTNGSSGTATFDRVTFTLNRTSGSGLGAALGILEDITSVTLTDCTFSNNTSADDGGAFRNSGAAAFDMTDCIITNNTCGQDGGGGSINFSGSINTFIRCSFTNNVGGGSSDDQGGGIAVGGGTHTFTNCTFSGNSNTAEGGAIFDSQAGANTVNIYNCTIANNTASINGGGISLSNVSGQSNMINCIIADNSAGGSGNDVYFQSGSLNTNTTNLVEYCTSTSSCPTFSVTSNPNFGSSTNCFGLPLLVLPISAGSSAENAGTSGGSAPADDICETSRNNPPDLGSYEIGSAMPVELVLIDVYLENKSAYVTWKTASETQNRGWEIEHSTDVKNWEWIGFTGGLGDSYQLSSYSFTHKTPEFGINYYRLKQIDYDGNFEYSDVRKVYFSVKRSQFSIYPNPTQNESFTIYVPDNEAKMTMYNYTGKLVRQFLIVDEQTEINVQDLEKGMYLIRMDFDGKVSWEKIIIQ